MTRTLLTGATGTLGNELRPRLREAGHDVVAASRSPPDETDRADGVDRGQTESDDPAVTDAGDLEWATVNLAEEAGIEAALGDIDVIVHAASDAAGDHEAVDLRGTERLVEAAETAGVSNFCYVSIVGVDEIPYSYYEHKRGAERAIEESTVPSTIVRATQFHEFVDEVLGMVAWLPVWPLPTRFRLQPIAAAEVADVIVEHATEDAAGRVPELGGPEVHTGRELAAAYRSARELRRPIVRLPLPGTVASAFRSGAATTPDRAVGERTWEDWLAERYE